MTIDGQDWQRAESNVREPTSAARPARRVGQRAASARVQPGGAYEGPDVRIKGRGDVILVDVADDRGDWSDAVGLLAGHISKADGFFRGERLALSVGDRTVTAEDLQAIHDVLEEQSIILWALHTSNSESLQLAQQLGLEAIWEADSQPADVSPTALDTHWEVRLGTEQYSAPSQEVAEFQPPPDIDDALVEGTYQDRTPVRGQEEPLAVIPGGIGEILAPPYIYRGTLRSGQMFRHAGTIVVLGDVNPGAQIISGGDVFVWGRLRGIVHAGAMGDENAVVAALDFEPVQLRIAGHIAMSPKGASGSPGQWFWKRESSDKPEVARVIDNRIFVDPWDAR